MNHRSRFLTMALVVVMILVMLPAAAQAADETGTTGIWKWKVLDYGTLSITGCTTTSGQVSLTLPGSIDTGSGKVPVTSCSTPRGALTRPLQTASTFLA